MSGAACCKDPCDGSRCHIECMVSTTDREECTCHCGGDFHGLGARAAGGAKVPLRERITRTRRAYQARRLTDEDLEDRFRAVDWTDLGEVARLSREIDRRDRAAKSARTAKARQQAAHDDWHEIAYTQYTEAESSDYVRGEIFSKRGAHLAQQRGVDELDLWRMPRARADVYASDELKEWWDRHDGGHPRTTPGDVRRQRSRQGRLRTRPGRRGRRRPVPRALSGLRPGALAPAVTSGRAARRRGTLSVAGALSTSAGRGRP